MDAATNAVVGPWAQLGIVGSVVLGLGLVVIMLWRALDKRTDAHLVAVERCHEQNLEIVRAQTKSQSELAVSLMGLKDVVAATLDSLNSKSR